MNGPKILVINPCNWFNKGDVTNRLGLVFAFKKEFGMEICIILESTTPELDSNYFNKHGGKVVKGLFAQDEEKITVLKYIKATLSFILILSVVLINKISKNTLLVLHRLNPNLKQVFLEYCTSDIIISAPGGFLSDNYIFSSLIPNLLEIFIGKLIGKPVILYAQSIGPFSSKFLARLAGLVLNNVDLIILREYKSKFWLEKMHVKKPPIYVGCDSTFSIDLKALDLKAKLTLEKANLSIGMTLAAGWVSNYKKRKLYFRYLKSIANFIDYVAEHLKAKVYILPQVSEDLKAAKIVEKLVRNKSHIYVVINDYTPEELMAIISQMDLFVGTRMHSNIFALLMGVPTICISYEHKGEGIMEAMGLEKFVIDVNKLTADKLIKVLNEIIAQKQLLKKIIAIKVQNMRASSIFNAKIVKSFWKKRFT